MSKFENWLCDEVYKIHSLHEIFDELSRVYERVPKFKCGNELRGVLREIGTALDAIADYEEKLNSNIKLACSKHRDRNERRRSKLH